jgi:hypothetical protein
MHDPVLIIILALPRHKPPRLTQRRRGGGRGSGLGGGFGACTFELGRGRGFLGACSFGCGCTKGGNRYLDAPADRSGSPELADAAELEVAVVSTCSGVAELVAAGDVAVATFGGASVSTCTFASGEGKAVEYGKTGTPTRSMSPRHTAWRFAAIDKPDSTPSSPDFGAAARVPC